MDDTNEKSGIEQEEYVYIEEKDEDDENANESNEEKINDKNGIGKVDVASDNATEITTVKGIATVTEKVTKVTNHNAWDGVVKKWVGQNKYDYDFVWMLLYYIYVSLYPLLHITILNFRKKIAMRLR